LLFWSGPLAASLEGVSFALKVTWLGDDNVQRGTEQNPLR